MGNLRFLGLNKTAKILLLWVLTSIPFIMLAQDKPYRLHLQATDMDSVEMHIKFSIPLAFDSRDACLLFLNQLPDQLKQKGYMTASLDSVWMDSTQARARIFIGEAYNWTHLDTRTVDPDLLDAVGWRDQLFKNKPLAFESIQSWQDRMLNYLENNGHPFARVWLDSVQLTPEGVSARWNVDKGPAYTFDSIRVYGNAKISNDFLQRYLEMRNGSRFSKEKLLRVSRMVRELPYVEEEQPAKLVWLNTGAILDMYLRQKRSSQVNVLIGFLPNNDQLSSRKLLVTGEANLNLKNALGAGETIGLNWQQLQVNSPRLHIQYQHPYLFQSAFGLDFSFDMFRKDSTFLNVNFQLGAQYILNTRKSGKIFIQRFQGIVNGVNLNRVLQQYRLPEEADMSAVNLGLNYEYNSTNYRLNPTRGNEWTITGTVGTKKIRRNNQILELKDPSNPGFDFGSLYDTLKMKTYQFRVETYAAHYFPLSAKGRTTLKTSVNAGFLQSANIFRNELFQIGGYRLLRGFDEQSQYLSQFAVGTAEFRYLVGQNSYFYAFTDGAWGRNNSQNTDVSYTYFGTGLGLAFESKVGIFNLAWAVGKRSDAEFNLRQSKIHFGFLNFF